MKYNFWHYLNDFDRGCMFVFPVEWISKAKFVILNLFISGSKTNPDRKFKNLAKALAPSNRKFKILR